MKPTLFLVLGVSIGWLLHAFYLDRTELIESRNSVVAEEFRQSRNITETRKILNELLRLDGNLETGTVSQSALLDNSDHVENDTVRFAAESQVINYLEVGSYQRVVEICTDFAGEEWSQCRQLVIDFARSNQLSNNDLRFLLELWLAEYPGDIDIGVLLVEQSKRDERYLDAVETLALLRSYQFNQEDLDRVSRESQKLARQAIIKLTLEEDYQVLKGLLTKLIDMEPDRATWRYLLSKVEMDYQQYENAINQLTFILYDPEFSIQASHLYKQAMKKLNLSRYTEVPLKRIGNQYQVTAIINGTQQVKLMVDTGASITSIDSGILNLLGVSSDDDPVIILDTAGGNISSPITRIGSLEVEGALIRDLKVASLDFSDIEVHGLLGMNFLERFRFIIDQKKRKLYLSPR